MLFEPLGTLESWCPESKTPMSNAETWDNSADKNINKTSQEKKSFLLFFFLFEPLESWCLESKTMLLQRRRQTKDNIETEKKHKKSEIPLIDLRQHQ